MFRILIGIGSMIFEIATFATEGAVAATFVAAGIVVTVVHMTAESLTFQSLVNRLTGCDLPEALEWPTDRADLRR